MPILRVAFAYVEPDGEAPECRIDTVQAEIEGYFEHHIERLLGRAQSALSARFVKPETEALFEELRSGERSDFLEAAQVLATRLDDVTDHRMNKGFFVAIQSMRNDEPHGVVLKLDTYEDPAAAVGRSEAGTFFEVVPELLELPDDLRKGAIYPDPREESALLVVDRFETQYFLKAMGALQFTVGREAQSRFMHVVQKKVPDKVDDVVEALVEETGEVSIEHFISAHEDLLGKEKAAALLKELTDTPKPVGSFRPRQEPLTGIIEAGDFRITGPAAGIRKVTWKLELGEYVLTLRVDEQPRRRYQ
jgi:hypothetical protein